jgi:ParB family chromosome partitioning protein
MKPKRPALGKGLSALIPVAAPEERPATRECPVSSIDASDDQPRRRFDDPALEELAASIKEAGVLQPLLVTREGSRFRVIAGERRLRAARMAGLATVPVVVRQATHRDAFVLALVENLQREDLNPVEQARAFQRLVDDYGMTQEEVARRVGKQRSTVANSQRLLKLAPLVLAAVEEGRLAEGTARALLPLDPDEQEFLLDRVRKDGLNTRQVEALVRQARRGSGRPAEASEPALAAYFESSRGEIASAIGLPVVVTFRGNRGRLSFPFGSLQAFKRIRESLLGRAGGSGQAEGDEPEGQ